MTRDELNEKARVDYGIVNAADMSEKQLKSEMLAIDKQHPDNKAEKPERSVSKDKK